MKWPCMLLWMVFWCGPSFTQVLRKPVAASYTGLGAYSIHHSDVFSFTANEAALAQIDNTIMGLYAERRFLLSALNNYTAAATFVTGASHFGLKLGYYGFSSSNESQVGLAYARKLDKKIDAGVQFNYNNIRIAGYGAGAAISFEIGLIAHITEELHAGIHINNPVGGKFGKQQQEKLPAVYTMGLGYDASDQFFVSMEIVKEESQPVTVNTGLQYSIVPRVLFRAGLSSATSLLWIGTGILWRSLRVDVTAGYHPHLGITPGFLLLFNPKKKEE